VNAPSNHPERLAVKSAFVIGAVLTAMSLGSPAHAAWSPPAAAARPLAAGQPWSEVAARDGAGLIHAAIEIPAPPRTVWMVMNDCRYITRLIASAISCRVLQGDADRGGWDIKETITKGGFFIPSIHNVYRSDYQPYTLIRFRKAGGNLRVEAGEWRLEPLNGGAGTRVVYENLVAADIMAPAALVREGMRKDTGKVLINLRKVVTSLGR
jgi:hypothetical protein